MKKKIMVGILVVIVAVFSCYVSYVNFKVANPIAAAVGLCKVIFTDADYAVVKENPKVVFVKPEFQLNTYMEGQGYQEDVEKREPTLCTFVSGDSEVTIHRSYNDVYGIWHWQE